MTGPRIAVVGVGAVAGYFTSQLMSVGHEVTCCVRRPFTELVVHDSAGGAAEAVRSTPTVVIDPADLAGPAYRGPADRGPADWVLVGVKAHQTLGATAWLDVLCGPGTVVVALQNGVEAAQRLAPLVHGAEVIPAVVYCGAELIAPGEIIHRTNRTLVVPDVPSAHALAALFADSQARIDVRADWATAAWEKLCGNAMANGITALTGQRSRVFARPEAARAGRAIALEVTQVAAAEGVTVPAELADLVIGALAAGPVDGGTSMLYDRLASRPLEHDAIYGAVVRAGQRHGVPTPVCQLLDDLLACAGDGAGDGPAEVATGG
jgi:2-dehydropantoate 2-reductase